MPPQFSITAYRLFPKTATLHGRTRSKDSDRSMRAEPGVVLRRAVVHDDTLFEIWNQFKTYASLGSQVNR